MYKIDLSEVELRKRGAAIRSLVQVLLRDPKAGTKAKAKTTISCVAIPNSDQYILGTFDGSRSSNAYRDWRFSSYRQGFRCMYFEEWHAIDSSKKIWRLRQICFSLFRTISRTDEPEVLAIHCEPMEPDGQRHTKYKRGLHLHVSAAIQPIPHAHFAINNDYVSQVMTSIDTLSQAIESAFMMVNDQVISHSDWKKA